MNLKKRILAKINATQLDLFLLYNYVAVQHKDNVSQHIGCTRCSAADSFGTKWKKLNLKWLVVSGCKCSCRVDFVHGCACMSLSFCEITSNAAQLKRTAGAWTTSHRSPTRFSILDWTDALVSTSNMPLIYTSSEIIWLSSKQEKDVAGVLFPT